MPRSKKNKLRAHEKRHPLNQSQTQRSDEATAMEEELPSCSSALEAPSQSMSPTESGTTFQESSGASAITTSSPGTFDTSSDDGEESQDEENSYSLEVLSAQSSASASPTVKVDVVEQFLLHKYRVNQPILRKDIETILGESKQGEYAEILKEASERIEVVFAIDLKEVDSNMYEFVSKLNIPNNGRLRAGRGWPKTGLLMNILGLIFMKGNCATEEDVWQFLNMLKVYAGKKHFIYGEPGKLINRDLVKLKYLEYRQVRGSDPPRHEYLWGPRAYAETSKMKVLEFMAKAGDTVPSTYSSQYEEALREKRARTRGARRAGTRARARPDPMAPSSSTQSA
ncbi:melanoma-associated antigen B5-like [Pteropus medius]|uniref:Melanoma-associated antigen B5-like n=1 Tax=Pteropus vampyrus TaxID=132908 RepID=A0A6P3RRI2_PTEVA|nr:melanoma-associated antigen B5-like [Pteropus vampyrus]XP_039729911.1 melanoma-associated antigen B5-like [Pteropus giganteus]